MKPILDVSGPNGRMAGEERRSQIVQVAVQLFSQRGFRGTTTKEIAQAAGISEAMVFRHFATKDDLYAAILDHKACPLPLGDPCLMLVEAGVPVDDRTVFEALALAMLSLHDEDPQFHRLLLHSALEGHELARMFWERTVTEAYKFMGAYIAQRQSQGAIRAVDPKIVVRAFIGMIVHHSLNNNLWDRNRNLLNISNEQAAHEFTQILFNGIALEDKAQTRRLNSRPQTQNGSSHSRKVAVTSNRSRSTSKKVKR